MSIEITGLEETKEMLDKIANIRKPLIEACKELCLMAQEVVERRYGTWSVMGNTDYQTEVEILPDGARLSVFGEDVGFLEFGAGVFTDADEFADQVGYAIYPGSWSETEGSRSFADRGFWIYRGVEFRGITPSRGMHEAYESILNEIDEVVKRKIEEWIHGS